MGRRRERRTIQRRLASPETGHERSVRSDAGGGESHRRPLAPGFANERPACGDARRRGIAPMSALPSRACVALCAVHLALPVFAADDPADEVVVTATRDAQRLGSTIQHTSVITEREIRASQAVDVPTLLRREAGVEFTQNGGIGRVGGLFVRGANPNQALILVDGVRINSATTGGTQIDQLLLDEIDRIEIVRGPGSAMYGSDAIGGVVQIFTKRGQGAPAANATVGFGNEGTQRYALGYGGNAGPWQFSFNGSYFRTDGFSSLVTNASPTANPDDDGYKNLSGSAMATYHFNDRNRAGFNLYTTQGRSDFDNAFAASPYDLHTGKSTVSSASVFTQNQLTEVWTSRLSASQGVDQFRDQLNGQQTSFFKTQNRMLTWQNGLAVAAGQNVTLGAETLHQTVNSTIAYTQDSRTVNSAFGGYTGTFGRNTLQGNLRYDHYSDFGGKTSYLAGYGYQLLDSLRATASYSRGFRAPSFNELFFPAFGNPFLQPEEATQAEVGLQYAVAAQLFRLAAFRTDYDNLIGGFPLQNVNSAQVKGVELAYTGSLAGTDLKASFTYQDPKNEDTGQQLVRRAKEFGAFGASRAFGPFSIGGEVLASGPRYDTDVFTFQRVKVAGYAVVNLFARYNFTPELFLGLRVDNLFDKDYTLASGYNVQGTLAILSLNYVPVR
jgi:vitamin B12 transporter